MSNKKIKIAAVVVLYKKSYHETDVYKSLLKNWGFPILIYDNSPEEQQIELSNTETYFHNPQNPGVSTAYNYSAEWAQKNTCTHLLLLDSDSNFPTNALKAYQTAIETKPNSIILPSMFSLKHKISPFYFKWGKSFYGDSIRCGTLKLGKILAINSGSLIPLSFFDTVKFNMKLPLDWSDMAFIRSLQDENAKAEHISLNVEHGLSEHESQNIEQAVFRFMHHVKGIKIVSSSFTEKLMMLFWAKLKAIKLSFRFKTLRFIGLYLKYLNA